MTEIERLADILKNGHAALSMQRERLGGAGPMDADYRLDVHALLMALKDGPLAKRMNARDLLFWRAALNEILGLPLLDEAV